jgi:hypothetical protein
VLPTPRYLSTPTPPADTPEPASDASLLSLRERRIAARVRLYLRLARDFAFTVAVVTWAAHGVVAVVTGQPVVPL